MFLIQYLTYFTHMKLEDFCKNKILTNLRRAAEVSVSLSSLFQYPFGETKALGSRRNIAELLEHLAWIPKEEILLMKGFSREEISTQLGDPILSTKQLAKALEESLNFFEKEIKCIKLTDFYENAAGTKMTAYEWCLEVLTHFVNHRDQLYLNIVLRGMLPSKEMLNQLFPGHLPMSDKSYQDLQRMVKDYENTNCNNR